MLEIRWMNGACSPQEMEQRVLDEEVEKVLAERRREAASAAGDKAGGAGQGSGEGRQRKKWLGIW